MKDLYYFYRALFLGCGASLLVSLAIMAILRVFGIQ